MIMRFLVAAVLMVLTCGTVCAQNEDEMRQHPDCVYCGMDRRQYAHSRMLVEYDDGSVAGTCSIHCAAVDFAVNIDKTPGAIRVGELDTGKLIDAETAIWVIGGSRPGVMTRRAKWAFSGRMEAERFRREHGGTVGTFEDAMKAAYEDMYMDTKMIREKRRMKKTREGQG